jgi:NAD(P)-dependent dehydrogenase (short-subunit alcohol dehydrogenase family)
MMNDAAARSIVRQPGMFARMRLIDRVALVPGASRAARHRSALGEEGATVYGVRGSPTTLRRPGTIDDTAEEVSARRGTGIAVRCDHSDDAQVKRMEVLEWRLRLPE